MATDPSPGRPQISCPDCGGAVRPDRERLCPRCGYPLMFLDPEPEPDAPLVARAPGEREDATTVFPHKRTEPDPPLPSADRADPAPVPGELTCPWCGQRNPETRVRCERCGRELRAPQPAPPPPPLPPPPAAPRRSRVSPIVVGGLTALVVALAAVAAVYVWSPGSSDPGAASPSASSEPRPVPAARVDVTASSVQPDQPQFAAAHLVDGDVATTWQSDADRLKTNVGVRLTFSFDQPVRLARITLVNGDGRNPTDYRNNERVAKLAVITDSATVDWPVPDNGQPQALDLDGAPTATVTLVVDAVYPGGRFRDVAVSEVSFAELR
jgi:hypothetical protein